MLNRFVRLQRVDPGFRAQRVVAIECPSPDTRYPTQVGFYAALLERLGAVSMVRSAALGANRRQLLGMVVREGFLLARGGTGLGLAGALASTRLLSSLSYRVAANDLATFGSVALLLMGIALLASAFPTLRATRVDPIVVLRHE